MSKTVLVQHYTMDGEMTETRMSLRQWNKRFRSLPQCQGDFYLIWWRLKKRWDGSTRRDLYSTCCQVGFKVDLQWRPDRCPAGTGCGHDGLCDTGRLVPVLRECED